MKKIIRMLRFWGSANEAYRHLYSSAVREGIQETFRKQDHGGKPLVRATVEDPSSGGAKHIFTEPVYEATFPENKPSWNLVWHK